MRWLRRASAKVLTANRRRSLAAHVSSLIGEGQPIFLDYPVTPTPRWGYGRPAHPHLVSVLETGRGDYERLLRDVLEMRASLGRISSHPDPGRPGEPAWQNPWIPPVDAALLYGMIALRRPGRYVEIGSGTSTAFARRAVTDGATGTHITSIDPAPRSHIDRLCDSIIRRRLEDVDLTVFDELGPGDMVFMDGSHRALTNSDATVFFLEVLPRLSAGLMVQIHDIFLPYDYPPAFSDRFYSEQYVLAAYLLAHQPPFDVLLPSSFVSVDDDLGRILDPLWESIGLASGGHGGSFWIETRGPLPG
jgi:predicted O-methyltransferase YrrM